MIFILTTLALCILSGSDLAHAQKPLPCKTPLQWQGRYTGFDSVQKSYVRAYLSYDAIYRRERVIEEYILGSDDEFFDVLYLHDAGLEYRLNLKTRNCTITSISRPWVNFGIPDNATSLGESYIGSSAVPNANLLTTIWLNEFKDQKGNDVEYLGVWTYEACLPISIRYSVPNIQYNSVHSFFDIVPGKLN
jgi:hypothetical protein